MNVLEKETNTMKRFFEFYHVFSVFRVRSEAKVNNFNLNRFNSELNETETILNLNKYLHLI